MHALFEGREIKKEVVEVSQEDENLEEAEEVDVNAGVVEVISEQQRQGWTAVNHELEESEAADVKATKEDAPPAGREGESRHHTESTNGDTMDGEAFDDEDEQIEVDIQSSVKHSIGGCLTCFDA